MQDEQTDLTTRRQRERERLIELHGRCPTTDKEFPFTGVLLSDAIKWCVNNFDLIHPFDEGNLKPANYKLTIGDQYASGGVVRELSDRTGHNELKIDPFQVAIIKTRETINMPKFLIARWNIRVQLAYKGLLWVGGPQVDAGYVGHLFCPIYNLSDKEVTLHFGEPIAVIDFVRTSTFNPKESLEYDPIPPERILFEDYAPKELSSALYTMAASKIKDFNSRLDALENNVDTRMTAVQGRVDNFVLVTFTVIAVLFAAVTIFVTRGDQASLWNPVLFLLSGSAVFMSAAAWIRSKTDGASFGRTVQVVVILFLLIATGLQLRQISPQQRQIEGLKLQIEQLQQEIKVLPPAPSKETQTGSPGPKSPQEVPQSKSHKSEAPSKR